jgi:hypothetical protein
MQHYWITIIGKSLDQNCTAADVPCCHVASVRMAQYDYEISITSLPANWSSLFHTADATVAAQNWNVHEIL